MISEPPTTNLETPVGALDHILGPSTALVTLVEYGDYECAWCKQFHVFIGDARKRFGDDLRFVYRHFVMGRMHPSAQHAAEAAEAAGAQGKFWQMHNVLFEHQMALDNGYLVEYASNLELDVSQFLRDMAGHVHLEHVNHDAASGERSGVNGTPTFFINGARYDHAWYDRDLMAAIEENISRLSIEH